MRESWICREYRPLPKSRRASQVVSVAKPFRKTLERGGDEAAPASALSAEHYRDLKKDDFTNDLLADLGIDEFGNAGFGHQ